MPFFSAAQTEYLLVSAEEEFKPLSRTIQHFDDKHALNLRELSQLCNSLICAACESKIEGPACCCEECGYYLHKSCAELPLETELPLIHPEHPLTLKSKWPGGSLFYSCDRCGLECLLDTVLSIMPSEESDETEVNFLAHEHPLRRFHMNPRKHWEDCVGCGNKAIGELYGCVRCKFYLHKRCFELRREVQHPLHPDHPLKPIENKNWNDCGRCHGSSHLGYWCEKCDFYMDMRCADIYLSFEEYMKEVKQSATIKHFAHYHELTKCSMQLPDEKIHCEFCLMDVSGEVYGCHGCMFFLHEACAKLPADIRHYLHPEHSLVLDLGTSDYPCDNCLFPLYGCVYKCAECSFNLHAECTLQALSSIEQGLSAELEHPVSLVDSREEPRCNVCREVIVGPAYFYVDDGRHCGVHKSCVELPLDVQHPFHPQHRLALRDRDWHGPQIFFCEGCGMDPWGDFYFYCEQCEFCLCCTCASLKPTLKHHLHEHSLVYFEENWGGHRCNLCHKRCRIDFYRCVPCNFNLHYDCLPLPRMVKCRYHIDPLTLDDALREDDSGEYYCDICEQKRNPDLGVYRCKPCKMISEIKCVLPMINLRPDDDPAVIEVNEKVSKLEAELEKIETELKEIETRRADVIKKLEATRKIQSSWSS